MVIVVAIVVPVVVLLITSGVVRLVCHLKKRKVTKKEKKSKGEKISQDLKEKPDDETALPG